jgi:deoxyadenosine/deoxycytidine kinase
MNYIVSIEGNIGVGKTTFLKFLERKYDGVLKAFIEDCSGYKDLVKRFYEEPVKYAYSFQVAMLARKCRNMKQALKFPGISVTERIPSSNFEVFAFNCYNQCFIDKIEWNNYKEIYNEFGALYHPPALIIYFNADPEFLIKRIQKRGRPGEERITLDYLQGIQKLYSNWRKTAGISYTNMIDVQVDRDLIEEDFERIFSHVRFSYGKFIERNAA